MGFDPGMGCRAFAAQTGCDLDATARAALAKHKELHLLIDDGDRVALSRAGRCVADAVIADFWRMPS